MAPRSHSNLTVPAAALLLLTIAPSCARSAASPSASAPLLPTIPPGDYRVLGANDLGMHCMDREYSVFCILPPFNVVNAQVLYRTPGAHPQLRDPSTVQVSYEGVADAAGSINSYSIGKTDFWAHAQALFGASLPPGMGLTGLYMPGDATPSGPQGLSWVATDNVFRAFGIPITPKDDSGATAPFPLLRIRATDSSGNTLATTDMVVPIASETDCRNCHSTGRMAARDPTVAWSTDPNIEIQAKWNVLILHDHVRGTNLVGQAPVLCASCHYSPALDLAGTGDPQLAPKLSTVMHSYHGHLTNSLGAPIFNSSGNMLRTCYQCHPGRITHCERGAMFTGGMQCNSCHGNMLSVGGDFPLAPGGSIDGLNDGQARRPWKDMPRCQSCHTGDAASHLGGSGMVPAADGIRLKQAWLTGDPSASPILATNTRFAENPNTLYRFSKGHGGVACEGCHGSTHAEWPNATATANDNAAALQIQGHSGPIVECAACHAESLGSNLNGPHGMHAIGGSFLGGHENLYEQNPAACKTCHGLSLQGTVLSRAADDRTFAHDGHTYNLTKGQQIACNTCHSMP